MPGRDIIVIGASAGGINPLQTIVQGLPRNLPAAVFVVVHTSAVPSLLPEVLGRGSRLAAAHARDGEPIEHGRIYVAPPDQHMLLRADRIEVVHGPRQNLFRPAIDPLFRTAAQAFGPRVVGIVLSGMLDDGTHGLQVIKKFGGAAIVQAPADASAPAMPLSAIEHVDVDAILPARRIPAVIVRFVRAPARKSQRRSGRKGIMAEHPDPAEFAPDALRTGALIDPPSVFTCPDCGGALWEVRNGLSRFQCHVGHAFTTEALAAAQGSQVEETLWVALRALEESARLRERMAASTQNRGMMALAERFADDARDALRRADLIRNLLLAEPPSPAGEAREEARPAEAASHGRSRTSRRRARRRRR